MGIAISEYQREAAQTDQVPAPAHHDTVSLDKSIIVPLLGLAGEAGSLLTEYKKRLRDGDAYRIFDARITEELGDILWYVANIATKAGLDLGTVAEANLRKINDRWRAIHYNQDAERILFDTAFPESEQLPRHFRIDIREVVAGERAKVNLTMDGAQIGDCLTDNAYFHDGYRFHDVFHLAHAAVLGWSPVTRTLLKRKRKSKPQIDEVEDGGRAAAIEEGICALVFDYASQHSLLEGVTRIDYDLLRTIKNLTSHLEVRHCSLHQWEQAILQGYEVWRALRTHASGCVIGDLKGAMIRFAQATTR
jgi:NTP pyrophosphatase (non-canonical NTP hydrolase)